MRARAAAQRPDGGSAHAMSHEAIPREPSRAMPRSADPGSGAPRDSAEPPVRKALRAAAFAALAVWIVGGPFYRQVLGGEHQVFRSWKMFSGVGLEAVDARFYEIGPEGARRELDWWRLLGLPEDAKPRRRRIHGRDATWAVARALCTKLAADADVRVVSRRGTPRGWQADFDGSANLCATSAPVDASEGAEGKP